MTILLIIVIILAIPFIRAFFLADEYVIEKQTTINSPKQSIFDYVRLLRNAENYNHRYDTSEQTLNSSSAASCGVLYLPPSAGLFDYVFCCTSFAKNKSHE
ncbi:MAG: hypothetical protein ACHQET_10840 [Chitinophagales bacterium]